MSIKTKRVTKPINYSWRKCKGRLNVQTAFIIVVSNKNNTALPAPLCTTCIRRSLSPCLISILND
ncbi:hypothetical protein EGK75_12610 [Neisseria weixii]|uniref:Uncharacterized protein n=1 Tax=Neisseria weixii TaxID=1853276 RepID=A0A3N4MIV3_9NEIS|nr:hypothetical protein EGK74_12215 [Neisseria weixii]RPD83940.1 hypothetical protein EGK75_12610 [Neisseria weixii]